MDLRAEDIARRLACHVRTARRWCGAWLGAQARPHVPRVALRGNGRRGRPAYVVDGPSFERWASANDNPTAND